MVLPRYGFNFNSGMNPNGPARPDPNPVSSGRVAPDLIEPLINPDRRRPSPSPVTSQAPELEDYTGMSIEFPYKKRKSDYPDDIAQPNLDEGFREGFSVQPHIYEPGFSPNPNPEYMGPKQENKRMDYEKMAKEMSDFGRQELQETCMMKNGGKVQSYTTKSGGINLGSGRVSTASKNSKSPKW